MKKHIFLFFIWASVHTLIAQRPYYRPNVHEIGLQVGAASYIPSLQSTTNPSPLYVNPANGLRYKHHLNPKTAIRGGMFYRQANSTFNQGDGRSEIAAQFLFLEGKVGIEKIRPMRKWALFGGIDLIGGLMRSDIHQLPDTPNPTQTPAYGAGAFVGVRRFLNENLSVSFESEGYYLLHGKKGEDLFAQEGGTNYIQIYLSYHFKRAHKSCTCGKPGS